MKSVISPRLIQSEPFEVAMGGYQVTVFKLIDTRSSKELASDIIFKNFLEISPLEDFSILIGWNSIRDESDMTLKVLDNLTGRIENLGAVHSIPIHIHWESDCLITFVIKVRPSISKLGAQSEYDIAKLTLVTVERVNEQFKVNYKELFSPQS